MVVPKYEKRKEVLQPQMSISRSVYRSPRDSERINLKNEQLRYDLATLQASLAALQANYEKVVKNLFEGNTDFPSLPTWPALDRLMAKVDGFEMRIKRLEAK